LFFSSLFLKRDNKNKQKRQEKTKKHRKHTNFNTNMFKIFVKTKLRLGNRVGVKK